MYFVIYDAPNVPTFQKDAIAKYFGATETIDWSIYKDVSTLKSALRQPSESKKYVVLTPLDLEQADWEDIDRLSSVQEVMALEDVAELIDNQSRISDAPREKTGSDVPKGWTPKEITPAERGILCQLATDAVINVRYGVSREAATQIIKDAGLSRLRDVNRSNPAQAAVLLASALTCDRRTISGTGLPLMDAFDANRIPVSLIDPEATELSELKKKFEDQKLEIVAWKKRNSAQLNELDKLTHDLSTLSQSNRSLADENEKLKTELNLKDGEIRNMVADGNLNEPGYQRLAKVLVAAYDQAARGKGKERHANDLPFHEQPMLSISELLGTPAGLAYQVCKKVQEALNMPTLSQQTRELYGAINYAAGIVIYLENAEFKAEGVARADSI